MPINPAYAMQGRTDHPAQLFRMVLAGLAARPMAVGATVANGGVNASLGQCLAVSGQASMNVSVGTGLCFIPNSTSWEGLYGAYNTAAYTVPIPSASSTQWRRDYIVAKVTDPGDNTASWDIVDVEGTFSSTSPGSLPAIPSNALPLGIVNVVPNMTVTNGSGTVQDARLWEPLNGVWTTTSSFRPATTNPEGTMWYETDTNLLGIIINGAYNYIPTTQPANTTWQSLGGAQKNSFSLANDLPISGYRITPWDSNTLQFMADYNVGSLSNGVVVSQLPSGWRTSINYQYLPAMTQGASGSAGESGDAPYFRFDNAGNVTLWRANSNSTNFRVNGMIRLA